MHSRDTNLISFDQSYPLLVEQFVLPHVDDECSLLSLPPVSEAMDIPLLLFLSLPPPPTLAEEDASGLSSCFDGDESVLS